MTIDVCIDCFDYIATGRLSDDMSIGEAAEFLGCIKFNYPDNRFKLEVVDGADVILSAEACDCCDTLEAGQRFEVSVMNVN